MSTELRYVIDESKALRRHPYELVVSERRWRTFGVTVKADGSVVVRVPVLEREDYPQVVGWLVKQAPRIAGLVAQQRATAPAHPVKRLIPGEAFDLLGASYRLRPVTGYEPVIEVDYTGSGNKFLMADRATLARRGARLLVDWYVEQGQIYAEWELDHWVRRMGLAGRVPDLRVRGRDMGRTKWGRYLGREHRIELNWQLFQLDKRFVQYVIVHELAHATRPAERWHHGPLWEGEMDRVLPHWRVVREAMTEPGRHVWQGDVRAGGES
ncbi:M48 family metallopeptidase [Streptomyces cacaoi]|uniref:M48 family metallopeptidase n=1 Tax=Streptomyces cacaoi TaxID=1898 RepID=UPI001302A34D|nr:SprT-like domain-containing protein [Streptomyces cacaoi]